MNTEKYHDEHCTRLSFGRGLEFITEAKLYHQCPIPQGYETVITGRSNAGKSTLINCLAYNNKLAKTSSTPGRTQGLVFFAKNNDPRILVDLPGYGYAKTSKKQRGSWGSEISQYLHQRPNLCGIVLIADCRRNLGDDELLIAELAALRKLPLLLVLSKIDKLTQSARNKALSNIRTSLESWQKEGLLLTLVAFSATTKKGLEDIQKWFSWCYAAASQ